MENEKLYRYFSGDATDAERGEIRRWVESGDENRQRFMSQRKFYDIIMMLAAEEYGSTAISAVPRAGWLRRWVGRVAAAAVIAGATFGTVRYIDNQNAVEPPMQQISVPAGQRLNIVLADGTSVWLNSNSTMRFPGAFTGGERRVSVDGEAYFTVAKDATHPFKVDTKNGEVLVTGTVFNVDAYSASSDFAVSLVEGSVEFSGPDGIYSLTPGRRIVRGDDGHLFVERVQDEDLEWVNGIISFRDLPLREIMARFEKYYGVSVELNRDDIADVRFSGKFYLDEGVEQALNTLRHDIQFSFTSDKDRRCITID